MMNFVVATLHESKRTVVINMSNVAMMIACEGYTEIILTNGDPAADVDESPAELINGVM